ncbi:hypothetical protein OVS_01550 [Mycoplasma ovis str. Michigan]|uniref:Uncharacterized protein n=1 Tax=Mycoplasma ovis str. Michigan TaxID=1415773 RepID=A0ABM5P1A9_9MOLU|nr:hypothetical protein [Mycoplasma ovis]AHC40215.1 hypothetical protein OVS_01550 [Mycoplasma ovis str. Michigan]
MSFLGSKLFLFSSIFGVGLLTLPITFFGNKVDSSNLYSRETEISNEDSGACTLLETIASSESFPKVVGISSSDLFLFSCSNKFLNEEEGDVLMAWFPKSLFKDDVAVGENVENEIDMTYEVVWNKNQVVFKSDKFTDSNLLITTWQDLKQDEEAIKLTTNLQKDTQSNIYVFGELSDCGSEELL